MVLEAAQQHDPGEALPIGMGIGIRKESSTAFGRRHVAPMDECYVRASCAVRASADSV